ncbi:hypothetical protein FB451DRAFT_1191577 [Mycena latifolia]|nr:hypothetical protein FB451DRAFT_1191577 [Mycena latifolia]
MLLDWPTWEDYPIWASRGRNPLPIYARGHRRRFLSEHQSVAQNQDEWFQSTSSCEGGSGSWSLDDGRKEAYVMPTLCPHELYFPNIPILTAKPQIVVVLCDSVAPANIRQFRSRTVSGAKLGAKWTGSLRNQGVITVRSPGGQAFNGGRARFCARQESRRSDTSQSDPQIFNHTRARYRASDGLQIGSSNEILSRVCLFKRGSRDPMALRVRILRRAEKKDGENVGEASIPRPTGIPMGIGGRTVEEEGALHIRGLRCVGATIVEHALIARLRQEYMSGVLRRPRFPENKWFHGGAEIYSEQARQVQPVARDLVAMRI